MRRRTAAALAALTLLPLAACSVGTTTEEVSYSIDQPLTGLVVDARAAGVAIVVGDGPVTVTEEHLLRTTQTDDRAPGRGADVAAHRVGVRGRR